MLVGGVGGLLSSPGTVVNNTSCMRQSLGQRHIKVPASTSQSVNNSGGEDFLASVPFADPFSWKYPLFSSVLPDVTGRTG